MIPESSDVAAGPDDQTSEVLYCELAGSLLESGTDVVVDVTDRLADRLALNLVVMRWS